MKKIISLFLASALLVMPLAATGGAGDDIKQLGPQHEVYFDYPYDVLQVFRYEKPTIPVEFYISGLPKGSECALTISSSLALNDPLKQIRNTFTYEKNHVDLDISFESKGEIKQNTKEPVVETIAISTSSSNPAVLPCTLELHVLHSQHGTFVSYINEFAVKEYYQDWLYQNGAMTRAEYEDIAFNRNRARVIDRETYVAAVTALGGAKSVQDANAYMDHTITVNGTNLIVSGSVSWTDSDGSGHPAEQVRVDIVDYEGTNPDDAETLGTTYTNGFGEFSVTVPNQTDATENGCDVAVRVFPTSTAIVVKDLNNRPYAMDSYVSQDVKANVATIESMWGTSSAANALQIHQAAMVGARYLQTLSGASPGLMVYKYPYPDSSGQSNFYSSSAPSFIGIKNSCYYSWDIILHEYGHYVSHKFGFLTVSGVPHGFGVNMIDRLKTGYQNGDVVIPGISLEEAKLLGPKIAWTEGWATYFGLAAQIHQNIAALGVVGAGDPVYQNLTNGVFFNCEHDELTTTLGEADEGAVASILWDLADFPTWSGSFFEDYDQITLGHLPLWNYVMATDPITLSELLSYILGQLSNADLGNLGRILGEHRLTAKDLIVNNNPAGSTASYYFTTDAPPTFSWTRQSGSIQAADTYVIEFVDASFNPLFSISLSGTATSCTLTNQQWAILKSEANTGIQWYIESIPWGTEDCATGPYWSMIVSCYFSNIL